MRLCLRFVLLICTLFWVQAQSAQVPLIWNSTTTYSLGTVVQGSSGNSFRAIHPSINHNPETDGHAYWELSEARTSVVLVVGSATSPFKKVQAAWGFIANAAIRGSNTIQISIQSATTYQESFGAEFNLNHPFGSQISIVGSGAASVVLVFPSGANGLTLYNGHVFGGVSGLTIRSAAAKGFGIFAQDGAQFNGAQVTVDGFASGIYANQDARINCGSANVGGFANYGIIAENNAHIRCENSNVSGNRSTTVAGIYGDFGAQIEAQGAYVTGCGIGFWANRSSRLVAPNAMSTFNGWGFEADRGSYLSAENATANNGGFAVTVFLHSYLDAKGLTYSNLHRESDTNLDQLSSDGSYINTIR